LTNILNTILFIDNNVLVGFFNVLDLEFLLVSEASEASFEGVGLIAYFSHVSSIGSSYGICPQGA
jgi:hypothetical protein